MQDWLDTHKPAASRRTHLLVAALMWTGVGTILYLVGSRWLWRSDAPAWLVGAALVLAASLGCAKARFVLNRTAGRIIARICAREDRSCLGGFLSPMSWGLVAVMMVSGRLLRASPIPLAIVGFIYATIGAALLIASGKLWHAWRTFTVQPPGH